ncbi:MAG: hypothetical protein EHM28_13600 [Spirochaetaceae bacterium]|nr:MAG: hypothetical protein EHM28_13600 [Spirochaetaceae bacterium]
METPNGSDPNLIFKSDRITVERVPESAAISITFLDGNLIEQTIIGTPASSQPVFDDGVVSVYIDAGNVVRLITQGATVSTYTVYNDNTAIETLDTAGALDYRFYFADASTHKVTHQAVLQKSGRALTAVFTPIAGGTPVNMEVTQRYSNNGALSYSFTNPTGNGRYNLQVTKPPRYSNINGVMFSSFNLDLANSGVNVYYNLDVFRIDASHYILVYYDADGNILYENPNMVFTPGTEQTFSTGVAGVTLKQLADTTIQLIEPQQFGNRSFSFNANGMMVYKNNYAGEVTYYISMMELTTGLTKFTGLMNPSSTPTLQFYAPVNQTFAGSKIEDPELNPIYRYENVFTVSGTTYTNTFVVTLGQTTGEIINTDAIMTASAD